MGLAESMMMRSVESTMKEIGVTIKIHIGISEGKSSADIDVVFLLPSQFLQMFASKKNVSHSDCIKMNVQRNSRK